MFEQAYRRFRWQSVLILLYTLLLPRTVHAFASKELDLYLNENIGTNLSHDTHAKLTTHVLSDLAPLYPDATMYSSQILSGASNEGILAAGAHTRPDDGLTWWFHNESVWITQAQTDYYSLNFSSAYTEVGFAVHLVEDFEVPAHKTVTFHGLYTNYALEPNNDTPQAPPVISLIREDGLETFTANAFDSGVAQDSVPSPEIYANSFSDPNLCVWNFWLDNISAGNPDPNSMWGDYGQGQSPGCTQLSFNSRKDWFSSALLKDQLNVVNPELAAARSNAGQYAATFLSQLPPIVYALTLGHPTVDNPSLYSVNFSILDNHTKNISYSVQILDSNGNFIDYAQPTTAVTLENDQTGQLPYGTIVGFNWAGTKQDGTMLPPGTYTLYVYASDGVNSVEPDDVNFDSIQKNDTKINAIIATPPTVSCTAPGIQWNGPSNFTCKASVTTGNITFSPTPSQAPVCTSNSTGGNDCTAQYSISTLGCNALQVTATGSTGLTGTQTVNINNNSLTITNPLISLTPTYPDGFFSIRATNCTSQDQPLYLFSPQAPQTAAAIQSLGLWMVNLPAGGGTPWQVVPAGTANLDVFDGTFGYFFPSFLAQAEALSQYPGDIAQWFQNASQYAVTDISYKIYYGLSPIAADGSGAQGSYAGEAKEDPSGHPDDSLTITSPQFPNPWPVDTASPVGVLFSGYGDGIGHLLGGLGVTSTPLLSNLMLLQPSRPMSSLKLLFIGSGASSVLDYSPSAQSQVASYVSGGGTLVVMTQPQNNSWSFLPRANEFSFVGWQNDQLYFTNSSYAAALSPIFNGISSATLNVNVDGYVQRWPADAKVLLRRASDGKAELIQYSYGQGQVLVGGLYTDYAYSNGSLSNDEKTLMQGIVNYALGVSTTNPNQPLGLGGDGLAFGVTPSSAAYALVVSTQAAFQLQATNVSASSQTIYWAAQLTPAGSPTVTSSGTFTAAAGTSTISGATLPLNPLSAGLNGAYTVTFNLGNSSGTLLGSVSGTLLFTSPLTLTLANAGAVYGPGQTVPLDFVATSPVAISSVTLVATIKNQLTNAVYTSTIPFNASASTTTNVYWNLALPSDTSGDGSYSVSVNVFDAAGQNFYSGALPGFQVLFQGIQGAANLSPPDVNDLQASCSFTNPNVIALSSAVATAVVTDPNGITIFSSTFSVPALAPSASTTTALAVFPKPATWQLGLYNVVCSVSVLGQSYHLTNAYDVTANDGFGGTQASYTPGQTAALTLANGGTYALPVTLTAMVPDFGFAQTFAAVTSTQTVALNVPIPSTATPGVHTLSVSVVAGVSTTTINHTLTVTALPIGLSISAPPYSAGQNVLVQLTNPSALPRSVSYSFTLNNSANAKSLQTVTGATSLAANSSASIPIALPGQIESGFYDLNVQANDTTFGQTYSADFYPDVSGLTASISLSGVKQFYMAADTVAFTSVVNANQALSNGQLSLNVYNPITAFTSYVNLGNVQYVAGDSSEVWFATPNGFQIYNRAAQTWSSSLTGAYPGFVPGSFTNVSVQLDSNYAWAATSLGLSYRARAGGPWNFDTQTQYTFNSVNAMTQDASAVWIASADGYGDPATLYRVDKHTFAMTSPVSGFGNGTNLWTFDDGTGVWIASYGSGILTVYYYNISTGILDSTKQLTLSTPQVTSIDMDSTQFWVATTSGLTTLAKSGGAASSVTLFNSSLNDILYVAQSSSAVWVAARSQDGTQGMVGSLDRASVTWSTFTATSGLLDNFPSIIFIGTNDVWFNCPFSGGVTRYTPSNALFNNTYTQSIDGDAVHAIQPDATSTWFGITGSNLSAIGVSRLDKTTGGWSQYPCTGITQPPSLLNGQTGASVDRFHDDGNAMWHSGLYYQVSGGGAACPLTYIDKLTGDTTSYTNLAVHGGFIFDTIVDAQYVWAQESNGYLNQYAKQGMTYIGSYPAPGNGMLSEVDGHIWFSFGTGDQVYPVEAINVSSPTEQNALTTDYPGLPNVWTANIRVPTGTQAPGGLTFGVYLDGNTLYILNNGGLVAYDKIAQTWSRVAYLNGANVERMVISATDLWLGSFYSNGGPFVGNVYRYNKQTGLWSQYTQNDGLEGGGIDSLAVDGDTLWVGQENGLSTRAIYGTVWSSSPTINGASLSLPSSVAPGSIQQAGKFYLSGSVLNSLDQSLASATTSFYYGLSGVVLTESFDHPAYQPGQMITATVTVYNNSTTALANAPLNISQGSNVIASPSVTLSTGTHASYSVKTSAQNSFVLGAQLGTSSIQDMVPVSAPQISANIVGPSTVSQDPFNLNLVVVNTGATPETLNANFQGAISTFTLQPLQSQVITSSFTIQANTTFNAQIGGSASLSLSDSVQFGVQPVLTLSNDNFYPAGEVDIPFDIFNYGALDYQGNVTFVVAGTTITRSYYVPAGQDVNDWIVLPNVAPGSYPISYKADVFSGTGQFFVQSANAATADNLSVALSSDNSHVLISLNVENGGTNAFNGTLRVLSAFFQDAQPVSLSIGATGTYAFSEPVNAPAGTYPVTAQVIYGGNVLSYVYLPVTLAPAFGVAIASAPMSVNAGQTASVSALLSNGGSASGQAQVELDWGSTSSQLLQTVSTSAVQLSTFSIPVPADLVSGVYHGAVTATSQFDQSISSADFWLNVVGSSLAVTASLDKSVYMTTDTAHLTLSVASFNASTPTLSGQVVFGTFQSQIPAFVATSTPSVFSVAVPVAGSATAPLNYVFYATTGRALASGTIYVNVGSSLIAVVPDKAAYNVGDTVDLLISPTAAGTLTITGPVSSSVTISAAGVPVVGNAAVSYTIAPSSTGVFAAFTSSYPLVAPMLSATYSVPYTFTPTGSTTSFSSTLLLPVSADNVVIEQVTLNKSSYTAGDPFTLALRINSNKVISPVLITASIQSGGVTAALFSQPVVVLSTGDNIVVSTGTLPINVVGNATLYYDVLQPLATGYFALADGSLVLNVAPLVSTTSPPSVSINSPSPGQVVSGTTTISVSATDAIGISSVQVSVDGVVLPTPSPTALTYIFDTTSVFDGNHTATALAYNLSTASAAATVPFVVDNTPPVTPLFDNNVATTSAQGPIVASSATLFSLPAYDPVVNGISSGLQITYYVIDADPFSPTCASVPLDPTQPPGTCANEAYNGPFALAVGTHTIYYFSEDVAGNQETESVSSVTVLADALPPRTTLTYGSPSYSSATLYGTDATTFGLNAVDDLAVIGDGLGVGVAQTYYELDGAPLSPYDASSFGFTTEGLHRASYYSVDDVGNTEVINSTTVAIDLTSPITQFQVLGASSTDVSGNIVILSTTPLSLAAVDPVSNGVVSGVGVSYYVVDQNPFSSSCAGTPLNPEAPNGTCANEVYDSTFTLSGGTHTVYYFSEDNVGNQENVNAVNVSVVFVDNLPPQTSLFLGVPSYSSTSVTYATDVTSLVLYAVDDAVVVGDGTGIGVAATYYAVDSASYTAYAAPFSIAAEGAHAVSYYSVDYDSHAEVARSSSVLVDLTSPLTTLQVLGSSTTNGTGVVTIPSGTPLALSALDPVSNGVASGVAQTFYVIDANPFSSACEATPLDPTAPNGSCANEVYDSTFTLVIGTHTVYYFSEDNVANQEIVNVTSITVTGGTADDLPPRTYLSIGAPRYGANPTDVSTTTPVSLSAIDDGQVVGDGAGVGVAATYVAIDSGAYSVYSGTFTLAVAGPHVISFYSVDYDSHAEVAHSSSVYVDIFAPMLTLTPPTGSTVTVSTSSLFAVYTDTASGISSATVQLLLDGVSVTTSAFVTSSSATYTAPYALGQGTHIWAASVADNIGNTARATSTFFLDSIPPVTTLLVDGLTRSATSLTLISTDTIGFVAIDSGTGVAQTLYAVDASTPVVYGSVFAVAVGTHSLAFHSVDKAGNVEASHIVALTVKPYDIVGPSLTLGPPAGSTVTITTPTITAVYADTITGVNLTTFQLDLDGINITTRAVVTASSATFVPTAAISQGTHTVTARVANNAGDVTYATSTFLLDSIPPVTSLLVDSLTASATSLIVVTTDTIGFVAVDTGAGVAQTLYNVNSTTYAAVYVSSFTLAIGTYTLTYHSVDKAGNIETAHSAYIRVLSSSTPSPITLEIALNALNFIIGDIVQVDGEVSDVHTATWTVGVAVGSGAVAGFTPLATGRGNASGQLATWTTLALFPSYYTIRLSASDTYGHSASTSAVLHLSGLLGDLAARPNILPPGSDAFGLRTAYAFPNPSNHGVSVDFRLETGVADSVDLHVYNQAGRRIFSTALSAVNTITDPTLGQQYAYDYVWGVGGIGTGVYTYVFVAHKSGEHDVVSTGKLAVIK